jgi:hypothetical protein
MRKLAVWIMAVGLLTSQAAMAADGPKDDKTTDGAKKTAPADATKADKTNDKTSKTDATAPTSSELAAELDQLRALLKEQADQLEQQREELAALKASLTHDSSASAANSTAPAGTSSVASSAGAVNNGSSTSAPVAIASNASASASGGAALGAVPTGPVPGAPQDNKSDHSPLSFKIGDAQFTPLGFLDFTSVFRTTGTGAGIGSSFGSIPYNNNFPTAGTPELRFSAQNSRIGFRVDAPVGDAKITGYVEADFLGAIAANANVTSNSDTFRMRLYFADYRRGNWEVLGGQDWTMLTPNRKGISPYPSDIFYSQDMDTNYQVGLTWARQPQFRVVYHANDAWTFGVSAENPDSLLTTAVSVPAAFGVPGTSGLATQLDATSGGTLSTPPTPNYVPDIIVKIANDSKVGDKLFHIEAAGLFTDFRIFTPASITTTTSATRTAAGGGVSVNANLELFKNFHLIANTFYSDGGGRYIDALGPDLAVKQATTTSPFTPSPIHSASGIGGLEYQATKSVFLDYYYGVAYYGRDAVINPVGGAANLGYGFVGSASTNNRAIQEHSIGWTQTFWQNPNYGKFQLITQGSYLTRAPWFIATTTGTPRDAHLFMVYLDLRYTLP